VRQIEEILSSNRIAYCWCIPFQILLRASLAVVELGRSPFASPNNSDVFVFQEMEFAQKYMISA
jgi:hypothetical protein